jgi:hypothetical protein
MLAALLGCAKQTVSALDYTLENELYTGDQPPEPPLESTEAVTEESTAVATDENTAAVTEATPSPDNTLVSNTQTPEEAQQTQPPQESGDPMATPEPDTHRYSVLVQDESKAPLSGARVSIYQDDTLLYSALTAADGTASWRVPAEHAYYAKATLAGYAASGSFGGQDGLSQDVSVAITLVPDEAGADGEAGATPLPVPEGAEGTIAITAEDVSVPVNQESFTLLDGVSAKTNRDEIVSVWVVDDGGFRIDAPGAYTVTYGVLQNGALKSAKRTITVTGDAAQTGANGLLPEAPKGESKQRYEVFLAYRSAVGDALSARIQSLTKEYQDKVTQAVSGNGEARILAQTVSENDTDVAATTAKNVQQTSEAAITNWPDVLATFLAANVPNEEDPLNVDALVAIPLEKLDAVFWDMNAIEVYRIDGQPSVLLTAKTYEDMTRAYNLDEPRENFLYELMQPEFQRTFASLTGSMAFSVAAQEDVDQLLDTLPEDMSVDRRQVVKTALSLVGKINYVWGGKYNRLGWNDGWASPDTADVEDYKAKPTGGLDCSGFVSWVFINAIGDPAALSAIGNGSSNQWAHSSAIGWDEGRPGDLVFYHPPGTRDYNHVGIIVSADGDGSYLVAHCSANQDGAVVTDAWSFGFRYLRRPVFFR